MLSSLYHRTAEAMGTRFELFLQGDDEQHLEAVAIAALEEVARLDGLLSRFDPRSEIARINREAATRTVLLDRELCALLATCERAWRLTERYFDVTRGAGAALELDAEAGTVRFTRAEMAIDLGGIGKGYALDCAREVLLRFGVTRALLHGGTSSVLTLDAPEGEDGWPIDLRHPLQPEGEPLAHLKLKTRALSCSAVRHRGQPESDVIDPLTGQPLAGDDTVVVLAATATEAEIFSTALLAMGRVAATRYLRAHPQLNLHVRWSEACETFVGLV